MQVGRSGGQKVPSIANAKPAAGEYPSAAMECRKNDPFARPNDLTIEAGPLKGALLNHSNEGDQ
jgi:hypothetical protein